MAGEVEVEVEMDMEVEMEVEMEVVGGQETWHGCAPRCAQRRPRALAHDAVKVVEAPVGGKGRAPVGRAARWRSRPRRRLGLLLLLLLQLLLHLRLLRLRLWLQGKLRLRPRLRLRLRVRELQRLEAARDEAVLG